MNVTCLLVGFVAGAFVMSLLWLYVSKGKPKPKSGGGPGEGGEGP